MKYSISNLTWGSSALDEIIPRLATTGLQGVEIAPTAIWPDLSNVCDQEVTKFKEYLESHNLVVSGVQSLLYGRPELQLFDQRCWGDLRKHLENLIRIGGLLGAEVAVFGSPKNRVKGNLELNYANELAATFLSELEPTLKEHNIILTLEPNAPKYGADYLLTYEDVLKLCNKIDSTNIKPQIDTGCLWMVGEDPVNAFKSSRPHHIHLSTRNLEPVPGTENFENFLDCILNNDYQNWLVIEFIGNSIQTTLDSLSWMFATLNEERDG